MKLPKQAKPVIRKTSTAKINAGVGQSATCEERCEPLPEPAESMCKMFCKL